MQCGGAAWPGVQAGRTCPGHCSEKLRAVDKAPAPVEIFFRGTRGEAAQPDWIEEKEKKISEKENKLKKKRRKRKEKTKVYYISSQ